MTTVAFTETDQRIANVSPSEQRERNRAFKEKIAERAASLASAKAAPPPPPPQPIAVAPAPAPCLCARCSAAISAEAMAAEPDPSLRAYPMIAKIQAETAAYFGVSVNDMISARRTANLVRPRQIAMYLTKSLTLKSLPEIGRHFGGRDHTTVLHAVRKMTWLLPKDAELAAQVAHLFNVISGAAPQ